MKDKRLKIFVDAHCFDAEYQGSRTFVKELYKAMAANENVELYLAAHNTKKLEEHFPSTDNVFFLQYKWGGRFYRLAYDIPRLIKKHRIDVAHFQYITPLLKNCKQVVTIHDVLFSDYPEEFSFAYRLLKKFLYKRSTQTADVITTVSSFSKASIRKHLAATNATVHVIGNGVNDCFFEDYNKSEAKAYIKLKFGFDKFILYVSRIEPRKNHVALLKAFLDIEAFAQGYHLVFIGHQTAPVINLQRLLNGLSPTVRPFVFCAANINDDDLLQFYRAASLFVYPSKAEGFGIPPLEAAAALVPVVCSASSAMREFSFFGDYHIDAANQQTLNTTLQKALTKNHNEDDLKKISTQIKQTYSWSAAAAKFYHLIKQN